MTARAEAYFLDFLNMGKHAAMPMRLASHVACTAEGW